MHVVSVLLSAQSATFYLLFFSLCLQGLIDRKQMAKADRKHMAKP